MNLNYRCAQIWVPHQPYIIAVLRVICLKAIYVLPQSDRGWAGGGNSPKPSQQMFICSISISSLLQTADKKCYNSNSSHQDCRRGLAAWCGGVISLKCLPSESFSSPET